MKLYFCHVNTLLGGLETQQLPEQLWNHLCRMTNVRFSEATWPKENNPENNVQTFLMVELEIEVAGMCEGVSHHFWHFLKPLIVHWPLIDSLCWDKKLI